MAPDTVSALIDLLDTHEKIALLSGSDVWRTAPIERIGLGSVKVTDGPNGARGDSTTGARAVCLPASIGVAATFDATLVAEVGRLLGRETARKGSHVLLAPTINMARHPLGGRNFESFGEDPLLTSVMAVAFITGVQDEGVGACAKHFVANDVEYRRLTVSSQVDSRTLREVYLAPFEAAVDAGVWTIMGAYSKLNGVHCTENSWLLTDLLRDEWGFDGLVMSDWGATHHATRPIEAGMDLEMPGPPLVLGEHLQRALDAGEIDESAIDERVRRVLQLAQRAGRVVGPGATVEPESPELSVDLPEERALARTLAADSMVLLSNRDSVLPLASPASIAVVGPNADPGVIQGGGSAQLAAHRFSSPLDGLSEVFESAILKHEPGCLAHRYLPEVDVAQWVGDERPIRLEIFGSQDLSGVPVFERTTRNVSVMVAGGIDGLPDPMRWSQRWTGQLRVDAGGLHQFGVLAVGPSRVFVNGVMVADNWTSMTPGDGFFQKASTEVIGEIELAEGTVAEVVVEWSRGDDDLLAGVRFGHLAPVDEDALLDAAVRAAASTEVAVVVVGLDADWETESHDRPLFGLPGRQNELVERVAAANPNTVVVVNACGPIDLPWLDAVPSAVLAWYPGQEFGSALGDVLSGMADAGGRLPVTFPRSLDQTPTAGLVPGDEDLLHYGEASLIGHRWFDANDVDPLRPFGYGQSYAAFTFGDPTFVEMDDPDGSIGVEIVVTNASDRAGKCVVQAYVEPPSGDARRPVRILGGFAVARLTAGSSQTLRIVIPPRTLEIWDDETGWQTPAGEYQVAVGTSSRDLLDRLALSR